MTVAARAFGWGHNPLRRRADHIGYVARLTTVALAIGALLFGLAIGKAGFERTMTGVATQAAVSRQVTATLTADAPVFVTLGTRPASDLVPARWTFAGREHHGPITAAEGSRAGSTMRIWVNLSGDKIGAPLTESDAVLRGWLTGAVAVLAALAVIGLGLRFVEWRLDRVRLRLWDQEWQRSDPQWTEKAG